ncbi:alpha/beta hydrolase [Crocosphaera sp.]|uniref:alpha/beta hydrolase n=1 Tax=Crocosphaera sp. TaxID=2729996 RepID=UPI003F21DF74|nr:alpha/beta hydrolase [Crocosphaera sp.]
MLNLTKTWKHIFCIGISCFCCTLPSVAAERINIIWQSLRLTLEVSSLEQFANEGIINQELEFYFQAAGLDDNQQQSLRELLVTQYPIDGVQLSKFLNTPTGEILLERLGILASVPGGRNGKYLLRGALIQAALDSEKGFSFINILDNLSTNIQVNVEEIEKTLEYQQRLVLATNSLIKNASEISQQNISELNVDYTNVSDIRKQGEYGVSPVKIIKLADKNRQRTFDVHFYQPKNWKPGKTPVIIVSHGLASHPNDFSMLGKQLASHGFFVAIPQHIGSDQQQLENMLNGYSRDLYDLQEFINRPLDITYVLDELEKRNPREFGNRLKLDKVGVIGHSFGGYTALSVAGATWDFENIKNYCDRQVWEANLSMLLQCQTLELPKQDYNFRDTRVGAIAIINPVNSVIFGSQGLSKVDIPIIISAGTNDPATPPIIEQIRTFAWVKSEDKYLFVMEGQAHFLSPPEKNEQINNLINLLVDFKKIDDNLFTDYNNAKSLAFFQFHLSENNDYEIYLKPGYWQHISDENYPIYWLDKLAVNELVDTYNRFKPLEIPTLYPN